jgi:cyanophycinase
MITRQSILTGFAGAALAMVTWVGASSGQTCDRPCVGPPRGAVIAAGGGDLDDRVYEEFVRMAGGPSARIVLIPTAGAEFGSHDGWTAIERLRAAGVERLEVLHTRSRSVADLPAFASPLEVATGVWFSGGRQWRLVDVYLGTRTHRALDDVLARGGVIGGTSAGASALASFLLRGGEDNDMVIATEREEGFGFLHNVAIDQHLLNRGRENAMFEVLHQNPHLLGIGLNEGAAVVVTGDLARVLGAKVAIYDVTDPLTLIPLRWLAPGDAYDLGTRRTVLSDGATPAAIGEPMPPLPESAPLGGLTP